MHFSRPLRTLGCCLTLSTMLLACGDDTSNSGDSSTDTETSTGDGDGDPTGDGDGDPTGDGDGDPTGDGDGDPTGDGDGDPTGDGDGDPTGDGDGDPTGDGDGDPTGDGDGDPTGDGDGDGDADICGDSQVTGDEVCDDGTNDGAYGGCNEDCAALAAYCGDGAKNGPEACDDANDGIADGCLATCVVPTSCADILAYDDTAADGVYAILPAGQDGEPFAAYCDMSGGGWTLAMRFAKTDSGLHFYSTHWTETSLLNADNLDPIADLDGKFPAFDLVPGAEIRGCMANGDVWGCKAYPLPEATTLLNLFTTVPVGSPETMEALMFTEDQAGMLEWLSIQGRTPADATVTINYAGVGINIDDDQSCYDAKIRFGLALNNEANTNTLNDTAGFGAQSYYTAACDLEGLDSLWRVGSGMAAGPTIYAAAGQIWIR